MTVKEARTIAEQYHRKPNPSDEDFFIFTEAMDFLIREQNNPRDMMHLGGVYLFDSFVAGTTHLQEKSVLDEIKVGDKLTLRREDNKFDSNAILILNEDKKKLGYVPEKDNIIFARLMDAGKLLIARISKITKRGSFTQISIGIYLVDF